MVKQNYYYTLSHDENWNHHESLKKLQDWHRDLSIQNQQGPCKSRRTIII